MPHQKWAVASTEVISTARHHLNYSRRGIVVTQRLQKNKSVHKMPCTKLRQPNNTVLASVAHFCFSLLQLYMTTSTVDHIELFPETSLPSHDRPPLTSISLCLQSEQAVLRFLVPLHAIPGRWRRGWHGGSTDGCRRCRCGCRGHGRKPFRRSCSFC